MIDDFEMCDEEKSYHEWVSQNLDFIQGHKQHIIVMKKLYMAGFAAGFNHKLKHNAQEELQK